MTRTALLTMALATAVGIGGIAARGDEPARAMTSRTTGMTFNLVRAGGFEMGSLTSEEGHTRLEAPHTVRLTRPFYMGVFEVTQAEYTAVMEVNPSTFAETGTAASEVEGVATARFPVDSVTWFDAVEFCNAMSTSDRLKPYYVVSGIERDGNSITSANVVVLGGTGYRLPTEAEWEYACRAGTTTSYNSGDTVSLLDRAGWFGGQDAAGNSRRQTHRVGLKVANDLGLSDLHGNVAEWCHDWYDADAYSNAPAADPTGPRTGSDRVLRGGSWNDDALTCRSAARRFANPSTRSPAIGFRVVRSIADPRPQKPRSVPPYRVVIDLRDGGTVDFFRNESFDSIDDAKERLASAKLYGRLTTVRIIDANGTTVD